MKYGSLFTGIGGFDLGFDRAGMQPAWQIERDKDCCRVLGRHWAGVRRGDDVCTVTPERFERADVICGGFPCQDLSVAGNRKGLAGERSGLWHEFHRILGEFAPRWCVIENVPGLFSSNAGGDFLTVLRGLEELGYCVSWCVLDSQYFGVPQRRDRVFLVGSLRDGSSAEILFEPESVRGDSAPRREKREAIAGTLGGSSQSGGFRTTDLDNNGAFIASQWPAEVAPTLNAAFGDKMGLEDQHALNGAGCFVLSSGQANAAILEDTAHALDCLHETQIVAHTLCGEGFDASEDGTGRGTPLIAFTSKDHGADAGEISPTLRSMEFDNSHANGGGQVAVAIPIQEIGKRQSGTSMNGVGHGKDGDPMFTLQHAAQHGVAVAFAENQRAEVLESDHAAQLTTGGGKPGQGYPAVRVCMMVRRLTPRECERLQGFPDDHTRWDAQGKEISDSARYRMLGNAVTTYPAEWIGRRIVQVAAA